MPETSPNTRFLMILIVLYGELLIYASLMPFTIIHPIDFQQHFIHDFWSHWPFNPGEKISGSDLVINLANVVASVAGSFLILLTGPFLITRISKKNILNLAIISIVGYLLYLGWTPFNFHWNLLWAQHKLPTSFKELLPLYHYAMGATLEHARLFVQSITVSGILVYLLRLRYNWFDLNKNRIYLALLIGLVIGLLQEGGQLFLVTRTPSMTDIYCFMIGGYIGTKIPKNDKL